MTTRLRLGSLDVETPIDWEVKPLSEVVEFARRPQALKLPEEISRLPMALIDTDGRDITKFEVGDASGSGTYFEDGDLLIARITPCFENGKQGIARDVPNGWGLATTEVYALRSERLSAKFLSAYLRAPAVRGVLLTRMEGATGRMRLPKAALEELPVPLPPPKVQARIVSMIESCGEAIGHGVRSFADAERGLAVLDKAIYAAALRGDLAGTEATDEPAAVMLERLGLDAIGSAASEWPSHWSVAMLGDLSSRVTSGSRDWKPYYYRGSGVFVLTQSVRMRELDLSSSILVDPPVGDAARGRSAIEKDDLLLTIVGANVGNVARVDVDLHDHFVCQSLALIRPREPRMSSFLELYLSAPSGGQRYFESCYYGQGRPHLSFSDIKQMPVPVPPLAEQERIVAAFKLLTRGGARLRETLEQGRSSADQARNSILHAAFMGRIFGLFGAGDGSDQSLPLAVANSQ